MSDLSDSAIEQIDFAFSIYDSEGAGAIDAFQLGDFLRALDLNPTNALVEKVGGTKKKGEKTFTLEELYGIVSQVKKDKDTGVYEDFIECLKLYDKAEDGHMMGGELQHILLSLGEKLTDKEVEETFKDCCDPEDDEGMIPYVPFLARICEKPVPESENPFLK